uniref:Putative secreted protein n=1 Tax=Ixodes ricinus TaxID=34613 RepID=A0A6B0V057_IXORI
MKASVFMSWQGVSTILAVSWMPSAVALRQRSSESPRGRPPPESTSRNSTVTVCGCWLGPCCCCKPDLRLNTGKARATAQPLANTSCRSHTITTYSSTPALRLLTSLVREWACDGVLCREHLVGRAANVARFRYMEQLSVGEGCNEATAALNTSSPTRGSNLDLTSSKLIFDKFLGCPIISTGW